MNTPFVLSDEFIERVLNLPVLVDTDVKVTNDHRVFHLYIDEHKSLMFMMPLHGSNSRVPFYIILAGSHVCVKYDSVDKEYTVGIGDYKNSTVTYTSYDLGAHNFCGADEYIGYEYVELMHTVNEMIIQELNK